MSRRAYLLRHTRFGYVELDMIRLTTVHLLNLFEFFLFGLFVSLFSHVSKYNNQVVGRIRMDQE
jgi:hypothetical protein